MLKTLDYILGVLDTVAGIAELFPGVTVPAAMADKLIKVAQAAVKAHNQATGQPLDLSLLQPLEPMPIPPQK
jgi:hypothetical protein